MLKGHFNGPIAPFWLMNNSLFKLLNNASKNKPLAMEEKGLECNLAWGRSVRSFIDGKYPFFVLEAFKLSDVWGGGAERG